MAPRERVRLTSRLGLVVWLALVLFSPLSRVDMLITLAPLVVAPLILRVLGPDPASEVGWLDADDEAPGWAWQAAAHLQLPAAACAGVACLVAQGPIGAALLIPWLGVTVLMAFHGLARLLGRWRAGSLASIEALTIDAGLAFPMVGTGWWILSRLGIQPLGFSAIIVLLTAAHFHFAGFALPVLGGLAAERLRDAPSRIACVGILLGVPLTAAGITASPLLEVIGATVTAGSAITLGVLQLRLARRAGGRAGWLLVASSLAVFASMTLALMYATGEFQGVPWPAIPEMVRLHGALNALGFGLLGVSAWNEPSTLTTRSGSVGPRGATPGEERPDSTLEKNVLDRPEPA